MNRTRRRRAGQSRHIPDSSTSRSTTEAGTLRPGNSHSYSRRIFAQASDHCASSGPEHTRSKELLNAPAAKSAGALSYHRRLPGALALLEGAEHPGHLFVLFHQAGQEVVRTHVVKLGGGRISVRAKLTDDRLVVTQEILEHVVGARILAGVLLETRGLRELAERRHGMAAQGARALGDVVDEVVDRLVLLGKELVQIVELRTHDVPVIVARLRVQHVFVGE